MVTGAINMLNMALCQPDLTVRARAALSEERSLVPGLMALLDHPLPVLRAKAIVTLLLLCTRCAWGGVAPWGVYECARTQVRSV